MNRSGLLIDRMLAGSAKLNDLVIPGAALQTTLGRHVFNLIAVNDDPTYRVSLVGSATAVHFKGRYFLLCSGHQLNGVDPERVSLMSDDGGVAVSSGGVRSYPPNSETDAYDIAAFNFTEPCTEYPEYKRRFFEFLRPPPDTLNTNVVALIVAGFPTADQGYELEERNHLHVVKRSVTCVPDGQPSDVALLRARTSEPLGFSCDGMSGGSAFVVQIVDGEFHAYFAGMVLRGGGDTFHILKSGYIWSFLGSLIAREDGNSPKTSSSD